VYNEHYLPTETFVQVHLVQRFVKLMFTRWFGFCIVSIDLFQSMSDVHVKRDAELSTDHHLLVCNLHLDKLQGSTPVVLNPFYISYLLSSKITTFTPITLSRAHFLEIGN